VCSHHFPLYKCASSQNKCSKIYTQRILVDSNICFHYHQNSWLITLVYENNCFQKHMLTHTTDGRRTGLLSVLHSWLILLFVSGLVPISLQWCRVTEERDWLLGEGVGCQSLFWNHLLPTLKPKQWRKMWDPKVRAYFKPYLQLHKTWQSANWQCSNCSFYNVGLHFDFTTTRILISCTLKYALSKVIDDLIVNNRFSFSMIILFVVLVNSKKWRRRTCVWTPIFRRCIFCILQLCNCKIRPTYRLILWNISNFR